MNTPEQSPNQVRPETVKFALLPQVDENGDDYLMAQWEKYGVSLTFWFREQRLKLFEKRPPKSAWQPIGCFTVHEPWLSFFVGTENSHEPSEIFRLYEEQTLPTFKQHDGLWAIKFSDYYTHHYGSVTSYYDMIIDLETMEIRYLTTQQVGLDN